MVQNRITSEEYKQIYKNFNAPITALDCGKRCAPYNVGGKPFCCDICHAVPTAYDNEWVYLEPNTDLWHPWKAESCVDSAEEAEQEYDSLKKETPDNMVLLECMGPDACQRNYRTLTCRQFPFFPYINLMGEFLGMSYYWTYEETCWVISNLQVVTEEYLQEFIQTFELIFSRMPEELETYQYHSTYMRDEFNKMQRKLPLLHRDGTFYHINARTERLRQLKTNKLPKFGPYKIMAEMPFPDEIE